MANEQLVEPFFRREPVLDKQNQLLGYQLAVPGAAGPEQMLALLVAHSQPWPLKQHLAFIKAPPTVLYSESLTELPPARIVLELPHQVVADSATLQRLTQLHRRGFRLCLDEFGAGEDRAALLPFASYVKLDVAQRGARDAKRVVDSLAGHLARAIASGVHTKNEVLSATRAGVNLFQGYYFTQPVKLAKHTLNPASLAVLEAMRLAWDDADIAKIEMALKRDVTLSFKLLRYINSAAMAVGHEVQSVRHAVSLLGYKKLYYWLTLLLATAHGNASPPALTLTAVTRGAFGEALALDSAAIGWPEELFMIGMFSLLDVMFDTPRQDLLAQMTLPPNVRSALSAHDGIDALVLDLLQASELDPDNRLPAIAAQVKLSADAVNRAHFAALARAETLLE